MSTKQTVKSCSCDACRRGKRSAHGQGMQTLEQRRARHQTKIALRKGVEDIPPAHVGTYKD